MLLDHPSFATVWRTSSRWALPAVSLLVWGAVAYQGLSWGLGWFNTSEPTRDAVAVVSMGSDAEALAALRRSLGAEAESTVVPPSLASRFALVGVMEGGPHAGAALMAVDGQPAKPYRVGAVVVEGVVLQSVQGRRISLGSTSDGPSTLVLELPPKP